MQAHTRPAELDDATLAFAEHVFHAARIGDSVRLGHLLSQGMPADLRNHAGDSLLMLASYHGRLAATSVLLDHGADAQLANRRGHTPLAGAAFKGDLPMVRLLVERGTDVESPCADGKTALMMAPCSITPRSSSGWWRRAPTRMRPMPEAPRLWRRRA